MNLEYIHTTEGRIRVAGSNYYYDYYLKDHLGNTRVVFTDENNDNTPEVLQVDNYYPFGMRHGQTNTFGSGGKTTQYMYNGKELQEDFNLDWYDYGARFYDAALGRWHVSDPLSEGALSWTPYRYCFDNPFNLVDPDGMWESTSYLGVPAITTSKSGEIMAAYSILSLHYLGNLKFEGNAIFSYHKEKSYSLHDYKENENWDVIYGGNTIKEYKNKFAAYMLLYSLYKDKNSLENMVLGLHGSRGSLKIFGKLDLPIDEYSNFLNPKNIDNYLEGKGKHQSSFNDFYNMISSIKKDGNLIITGCFSGYGGKVGEKISNRFKSINIYMNWDLTKAGYSKITGKATDPSLYFDSPLTKELIFGWSKFKGGSIDTSNPNTYSIILHSKGVPVSESN
jgi:RHS repeat-associated protein